MNNKQFLILMYGPVWSWKTTLSKKIEKKFKLNRICNDSIREYFIKNIQYYKKTDISYSTSTSNHMWEAVSMIRDVIIKNIISMWESIILDSWNIKKATRKNIFDLKKHATKDVKTVIINCNIDEKELVSRLEKRDSRSKNKTKRKDFFLLKQRYKLENLEKKEADFILNFNQKNTRQIFLELQNIIDSSNKN